MQTESVAIPEQKSVEVIVGYTVLGEKNSIVQLLDQKYLQEGEPIPAILKVVQVAHRELHYIASALGVEYGTGRDPNLEMLCTCRGIRHTRLQKLRNVLDSLKDGTFSLTCHKTACPRYKSGCEVGRDLSAVREALPEAEACTWFRKLRGDTLPIPKGKRTGIL